MDGKPKKRNGNGKPFVKGDPRAGRPKGCENKVTAMGREFALGVLNSQAYRDWLKERVESKTLPPQIEVMLWHYAVGKPKETVELSGAVQFSAIERVIVNASKD